MRGATHGAFLALLAPFPFDLSLYRVLLATLRGRNFASRWLLDAGGRRLNLLPVQEKELVPTVSTKK